MTGIGALAPALLLLSGGTVAWRWLGAGCATRSRRILWAIGLAPALGFGTASLVVAACTLLSLRLPDPIGFAALLIGLFTLFFLVAGRLAPRDPPPVSPPQRGESTTATVVVITALALAASGAVPTLLAGAKGWPDGTWDAVAIWNARARLLFRDASIALPYLSSADEDSQPGYPLLVPGTVSATWALMGYESKAAAAAVSGAWFVAILVLTGLGLSGPRRRTAGLAGVALLLSTPAIVKWVPSQCADLAVAYALLLGGLAAARISGSRDWPGDRLPAGVFGWSVGFLASSKNEGLAAALALLVGWSIAALAQRRAADRPPIGAALWTALPFLVSLVAQNLALSQSAAKPRFLAGSWILRLTDPERWSSLCSGLLSRFDFTRAELGWSLFWPTLALVCALSLAMPRHRPARAPAIFAWAALAAIGAIALVLSSYDIRYVVDTALDRLLLQIAPLGLVLALGPLSGTQAVAPRTESVAIAAARRVDGVVRTFPVRSAAAGLVFLLAFKMVLLSIGAGAMWRWPEELAVATFGFSLVEGEIRSGLHELGAPVLSGAVTAFADLLGLEGDERYRALLFALNLGLALLLGIAFGIDRRPARMRAGLWAAAGALCIAGWAALGDALAGAAFLVLTASVARVETTRDGTAGRWLRIAGTAALAALADPTLGLPIALAITVILALRAGPSSARARQVSLLAVLAPLAVGASGSAAGSFARGAGEYLPLLGDQLFELFATRGLGAVPDLLAATGRELGYLHVASLGWAIAGPFLVLTTRRLGRRHQGELRAGIVLLVVCASRALIAGAAMTLESGSSPLPRYLVYGRALDFALPAGLWLGALAVIRFRSRCAARLRLLFVALVSLGSIGFLLSLPSDYFPSSLRQQGVPFQTGVTLMIRSSSLSVAAPWIAAVSLALAAALVTVRRGGAWRAGLRSLGVLLGFVCLGGMALAATGEIAIESKGSRLYHSNASDAARRARDQGLLESLEVEVKVLGRRSLPVDEAIRWKDQLRTLADLPRLAVSLPPGTEARIGVLTERDLEDRPLIDSWYDGRLKLWGARTGESRGRSSAASDRH